MTQQKVIFNVLAKDITNAIDIVKVAGDRILVGLMVKSFPDEQSIINEVKLYKEQHIPVSVGLGAGDPTQWKKVADVSVKTIPDHINQVFPASAYTLGRMEEVRSSETIINALIEPSGIPGKVMISTGPNSSKWRETVSVGLAASMLADIGVDSVKFYPIDGDQRLDEVAEMVKAATGAGIKVFEPTGGITLENVERIVQTCLENGAQIVIPHLYTSLVDKDSGETRIGDIERLISMEW
ncbi:MULTISPECIES: KDGP aldolase [Heyndrickxia]|jgi:2-dehydro-3-deoxy-phosphogluconate aldolase|uniref:KDGP aldolase n=1 Tax=Heyndrickxia TaxID=2837504 RepID=UPI0024310C8C|nr:KDGP aldolase [Heyndrickxia oleronia]MCI1589947.1 KDGP aldolase [Heyndrickxia oleronia]MCI1611658.1 KDGP aldolase [Heyndrickxia oleronia]MCI1743573.1 KDGP aldolase [Heyndrickxia oleronia]MCI1760180.1 KDGP aldolase [Heyndrickxia oleronia]